MRWWWQTEPEEDEKVVPETDPVKHRARQETEFIRTRLRLVERLVREEQKWIPPQSP